LKGTKSMGTTSGKKRTPQTKKKRWHPDLRGAVPIFKKYLLCGEEEKGKKMKTR